MEKRQSGSRRLSFLQRTQDTTDYFNACSNTACFIAAGSKGYSIEVLKRN